MTSIDTFKSWTPDQVASFLLSKEEFSTLSEQEKTDLRKRLVENHVNGHAIAHLKHENLTEMGIQQVGLRVLIMSSFEEFIPKKMISEPKALPVISRAKLEPDAWSADIKMSEPEKMLAGLMYLAFESGLPEQRERAKSIIRKYNQTSYTAEDIKQQTRQKLLTELFGEKNLGKDCYIEPPFYIDYGSNTILGDGVYMNYNCIILDICEIKLGKKVFFAPNVQLYSATHPLNAKLRTNYQEYGAPITIGDNTWLGGGAIVMGGVTIGENCVIGAGAVVTKNIPPNSLAVGNPARVIAIIAE